MAQFYFAITTFAKLVQIAPEHAVIGLHPNWYLSRFSRFLALFIESVPKVYPEFYISIL